MKEEIKLEDIQNSIKKLIIDEYIIIGDIEINVDIKSRYNLDSLDKVDIIMKLEKKFTVNFPDSLHSKCSTIEELSNEFYKLINI